jgi:hypothetical protein
MQSWLSRGAAARSLPPERCAHLRTAIAALQSVWINMLFCA